jgi:ketosteroid isomerase-like protein
MEHRTNMAPLDVIRAYFAAWDRGDREEGWSYCTEDGKFHALGRGPLARTYHGREDFAKNYIQRIYDYLDEWQIGPEVNYLSDGPNGVTVTVKEVMRKGDREIPTMRLGCYRIKDGAIFEEYFTDFDQASVEEFLGDLTD